MRVVRGIALFALCALAAPRLSADEPDHRKLLDAFEKQLQEVSKSAGPSIACVVVSRSEHYPKTPGAENTPGKLGEFDRKEFVRQAPTSERAKLAQSLDLRDPKSIPDHGCAGGVVIDPEGYVLTPYHVIDGATRVYVFVGGGGSYADIHAADARSDLAVLKLIKPPAKLKAIKIADVRTQPSREGPANLRPGKLVLLMANPYPPTFDPGQPSAAFGSIANVRHRVTGPAGAIGRRHTEYGTLLEYDVKLNAGVTGAALLNLDGELIGMANAAAVAFGKDVGPGYAVAMDPNVRRMIGVLRRGEEVEYGFLGVQEAVRQFDLRPRAVDPVPGGAAALAGIRRGDVITRVNGTPVDSFNDLLLQIGCALAGSTVTVTVSRDSAEHDLDVTLSKARHDQPFVASVRPEPVFGLRVDYGSLLAQQRDPRKDNPPPIPRGVCVREVLPDSPAAKQFKTLGDAPATSWLITSVNGTPVSTPAEFHKLAKGRDSLKLTVTDPESKNPRERELTIP